MKARKHASQAAPTSDVMVVELKQHPLGLNTPKRKRVVLVALVAIIVIAGLGYAVYKNRADRVLSVCDSSMTQEGNTQNNLQNSNTFTLFVGQVKAMPNYTRDPNCMYMIAEYQIATQDMSAAKSTIAQLKSEHGSAHVYDKNLDNGHASLSRLQTQFDIMQQALNNAKGTIVPAI